MVSRITDFINLQFVFESPSNGVMRILGPRLSGGLALECGPG